MEILNNFASIYCFITFIFGAVFMLIAVCVVAMGKVKEPRNKVRFFVTKDSDDAFYSSTPILWFGVPKKAYTWCPTKTSKPLAFDEEGFKYYGLNFEDFTDMKEGEIREVFLNLED